MGKNKIEDLYFDAIKHHLERGGFSEFLADTKARRRMQRDDELK